MRRSLLIAAPIGGVLLLAGGAFAATLNWSDWTEFASVVTPAIEIPDAEPPDDHEHADQGPSVDEDSKVEVPEVTVTLDPPDAAIIEWSDVGAQVCEIERNGEVIVVVDHDLMLHRDEGLEPETDYDYRLRCGLELAETVDEGEVDLQITGDQNGFVVEEGTTVELVGDVTTDANVEVFGTLKMRAGSTLTFTDIDEDRFVGPGDVHQAVREDVGLWVLGNGQLDIRGTSVEGWNTTGEHATWSAEHNFVRAPHGLDEDGPQPWSFGEEVPCTSYGDEEVCAEVVNRTRDVIIQGTESGNTHLFIHSQQPQTIKHATIRYVGTDDGGPTGRYGLHFHHAGDGSRGSTVEGVLIENSGSHAFVAHASHGVTFRDTVALHTTNAAYWWDPDNTSDYPHNATHDVTYDRALALDVQGGYQSNNELAGFYLGQGVGNRAVDSAAVDVATRTSSRQRESSGFYFPRSAQSVPNAWQLENLTSHHNSNGMFTRRNRNRVEPEAGARVDGFTAYQNREWGIYVGPYRDNVAVYDARLFANDSRAVRHRTGAGGKGAEPPYDNTFTGVMDAAGGDHVILLDSSSGSMAEDVSVVWRDLTLRGWSNTAVRVTTGVRHHDFVEVDADGRDLEPSDFDVEKIGGRIRVQRADGTAFQIDADGVTDIAPFA